VRLYPLRVVACLHSLAAIKAKEKTMFTKIIVTTGVIVTVIYQAPNFILRVAKLMLMTG